MARALGGLAEIDGALVAGRLSYAKVRALTRFATVENDDNVLATAMAATGAQLERIVVSSYLADRAPRATAGRRPPARSSSIWNAISPRPG